MSVVSVNSKSFILALFIRDDDERFLLGDSGYDFKDSQLHFVANTMENDEVAKQGADGVMLAGQVRRASVQPFDGYIGDATDTKEQIEEKRKAFIAFFAKGHHFRVVYVDCNRNAWQRKGGYIVDAPEVKEIWQIHPEYHVGLNFEDVNYYSYNEDAQGNEILSNEQDVPIAKAVSGGLVWDEDGAVSEEATTESEGTTANSSEGTAVNISDSVEAPIVKLDIKGNTVQNGTPTPSAPVPVQTVTGENVVKICGKNLYDDSTSTNAYLQNNGSTSANDNWRTSYYIKVASNTQYMWWGSLKSGQSSPQIIVAEFDSSKQVISGTWGQYNDTSSRSFTTSATSSYVRVSYRKDKLENMQLELGSTATAYEPYKAQNYEVNLDIGGGKNLLKYSWPYTTGYYDGSGNWNTDWRFACYDKYFEVEPNTTYSFSSSHSNTNMAILWFDENKNWISRVATTDATSASGTSPATAKYARLQVRYETSTGISYWLLGSMALQFEQGSVSSYEPFVCYELCGLGDDGAGGYLYRDGIYKNLTDNKWYVHKETNKIVFDGTESWQATSGANPFYVTFSPTAAGNYCDSVCSHFRNLKAYPSASGYFAIRSDGTSLSFNNSATATLSDWKTWLGSNNTAVYFPLATPTDTEITNSALIEQLDNLASAAYTYQGQTNISDYVVTGNSQAMLKAEYYTSYKVNVISGGYVWEAGGSGGPTTVVNDSISNVSPIWTVHGPVLNPILENTTTNEEIEYVGMIADGQTLVVDMGEQTASLNGLNVVSNIVGDYISLAPGRNILLYSATSGDEDSEIGWSEIVG